jgi:FLVCR family feline leukemia virus subgroup C receptor-related protein
VFSVLVEKDGKYKNYQIICSIVATVGFVLFALFLYLYTYGWLLLSVCLIGLFNIPLLPLGLDFGCETTFPIGESFSTGILMTGG